MGKETKEGTNNAIATFHHVVAKGDLAKVKELVGGERKEGDSGRQRVRIPVNSQDERGLAAVHWAAMRGHKKVLQYLIEQAPENNRADPTILDDDGWSAITWAVFMVEQEHKMVGSEHGKRKQLCEVINYLAQTVQNAQEIIGRRENRLGKSTLDLAKAAALSTDEAVMAAIQGNWNSGKTYGHVKVDGED